jgi:hypothetical protein
VRRKVKVSELSFIDQARKSQPYYQFQEELLSRLLGLAYSKGIYEASVGQVTMKMGEDNMYMFTYENNMNQFEAAMLILGQPERWDQDFEIMLQDKFEQYHVPTYGGSIDENCTRPLFLFRLAIAWLRDPAGGVMVVQKQPTRIPDLPATAPLEGELVDDELPDLDEKDRKAKGNDVEYEMIKEMPVGSTILEIILVEDGDEPEKQVIFNASRLSGLIGSQRPDISEVKPERIFFVLADGTMVAFWHYKDCCESVYCEDIEGDLFDLIGRPLVVSETAYHSPENHERGVESETWTYYRIATPQGMVTLRWLGSSNGYYSEHVSVGVLKGLNIPKALKCSERWDFQELFEDDDD